MRRGLLALTVLVAGCGYSVGTVVEVREGQRAFVYWDESEFNDAAQLRRAGSNKIPGSHHELLKPKSQFRIVDHVNGGYKVVIEKAMIWAPQTLDAGPRPTEPIQAPSLEGKFCWVLDRDMPK